MEFREGTPVYTARDEHIGNVDKVVLDPRTGDVLDVVVLKGVFFPEDRVVPIGAVATATAERINLRDVDPDVFPRFEVRHYVTAAQYDLRAAAYEAPLFWYGQATGPPLDLGGVPQAARTVVDRMIPEAAVALDTGAGVVTSDDELAGTVEEVLTDADGRATHLVVVEGAFRAARKAIPLDWVAEIGEDGAVLAVASETVGRLPDYLPHR